MIYLHRSLSKFKRTSLYCEVFLCHIFIDMNLKDYKQVSVIYSTTDDMIFYVDNKDGQRSLNNVRVHQIQRIILRGWGIFPLVVKDTSKGFYVEDGHHRLQAIININKKRDEKIEIPFYINWEERYPRFPEGFNDGQFFRECPSCGYRQMVITEE